MVGIGNWLSLSRLLAWAIVAVCAAGFSGSAIAATLNVNNQSGCSDATGNPYCTINAAVADAGPGDTVVVAAGFYSGRVLVNHSGTSASARIIITTSQNAVVTSTTQGFDVAGAAWVTINGFTIDQTSAEGIRCVLCTNVTLSNNLVKRSNGIGIYIANSTDTVLSANNVEDSRLSGISLAGSQRITVTNGYVKRSGLPQSGLVQNGIIISATSDSLVDGTEVANNSDIGVYIINGSTRVRIKRVTAHHNARQFERIAAGIESRSAGNYFESNVAYENEDSGINMRWGGADGLMVNNVTYLNGDHGIDVLESPRPIIVNNTVYGNVTSGINIEGNSGGGYVYNNISVDNALNTTRKKGEINIGNSSPVIAADYNHFSACCGSVLYVYNGTTFYSLTALRAAFPSAEVHGIQALPGWVNQTANDFRLAAGSPSIDSAKSNAIATSETDQDADGNARCDNSSTANTGTGPITFMDRGAYERTSGCGTPDTQAPTVPTGLAGTAVSSTAINLSWSASTDNVAVTGYKLFRGGVEIATITSGLSHSDTGLTASTTYSYRVAAFDAAGNTSNQSTAVPVTTQAAPDTQAPTIPTGLAGTAVSSTAINLSWSASTDNVAVTGYKLFRGGVEIATITSGLSYSDTGLTASTTYSYRVAAFDAAGNTSNQSTAVPVTTQAAPDTQAPTVPTGLAGTAVSSTAINLSWSASTDNVAVTGYKLFRGGVEIATITSGLSYSDIGLTAATTYSYRVAAFDAAGNTSNQSTAVPVTTDSSPDTEAPTIPTGLAGSAVSATAINLSWSASTDNVAVTGYKLFRGGVEIATVTSGLSYSDTGLTASTTYSYRVAAFDAAGNTSNQSTAVPVTTDSSPDTEAPTIPTGLTGTAVSATAINLSWSASTDNVSVTGYKLFRGGVEIATITSGLSYSDTGLTASTTYSYRVAAFDAAGNTSNQSTAVPVTTESSPDTEAPTIPTGLAGTAVSSTAINLSWSASTDNVAVTGYKLFRGGVEIATITSGLSYSDTGLTASTTYSYRVAAFDAAGNTSNQSSAVPVTTQAAPDTQAPTVPTGLAGTAVSSTAINLSWSASTDNVAVSGYKLFRGGVEIATITSGLSYSDTGLTASTTYSYRVAAFDAAGNTSNQSTAVPVTTQSATIVFERRISASNNDAEEFLNGSTTRLTSPDLELITDGTAQVVGLRFNNVTLPRTAVISNAYIQFTTHEVSTGSASLTFAGHAHDNSPVFTTAAKNITTRTKTTATANWSPATWNTVGQAGASQRTPNLSSVAQAVVSRTGWTSGNALTFIISGSGRRNAKAFDTSSGTAAPLLHIEYTVP